jgi:hypothetical protein
MTKDLLTLIGLITLFGLIFAGVYSLVEFILDSIRYWKRTYEYKHRFGKKPIAKCYCHDCKWHNNETGRCFRFHEDSNRLTGDTWFCYMAEPRKE